MRAELSRNPEHTEEGPNPARVDGDRSIAERRGAERKHHHCRQSYDRHDALDEHRPVANLTGVGLAADLLRSSAARHDRVEARAGAAGDRDEQDREEGTEVRNAQGRYLAWEDYRRPAAGHGRRSCQATDEKPDPSADHGQIEQPAGQIISRLKQDPHRCDGGYEAID